MQRYSDIINTRFGILFRLSESNKIQPDYMLINNVKTDNKSNEKI